MMERTAVLFAACWIALAILGDSAIASSLGRLSEVLWLVPILGSVLLWRIYCRD